MDILKKLKVALKSRPVQPQAQPESTPQKTPTEQGPTVQASLQTRLTEYVTISAGPGSPAQPGGVAQPGAVTTQRPAPRAAATPAAHHQPQAPVWAQTPGQTPRPQASLSQAPRPQPVQQAQPLRMTPRVVATPATRQPATQQAASPGASPQTQVRAAAAQTAAAVQSRQAPQQEPRESAPHPQVRALELKTAQGAPGTTAAAGATVRFGSAPGFWRKVGAMHPNRTKRRLRRLLLSWERLGAYMSSTGDGQELTPAAETAFLRTKIEIARSVGYLKLLDGTGGIAKEAAQKETQFIELLERFPSLHSARTAGDAARRNLYYNWHQLYLFLHKMLGSDPYEAGGADASLGGRVETVIPAGRTVSTGGRRTG